MKPISPSEREYLDSIRSKRKRSKPKPGRPEDSDREKCVCFLSTCVTESEMDAFEILRLREPFPPSRSTFNRFLIKAALLRFEGGFPETFVAAWAGAGLPTWWGPEASSHAQMPQVTAQGNPAAVPPRPPRAGAAPAR